MILGRKVFDKIQHPFIIETVKKVGVEITYLLIISTKYDKSMADRKHKHGKLRPFPYDKEQDKEVHSQHVYST